MKPGRVVLLVLGSLLALLGVGLLIGSGSLSWAIATQRDSDGFFTTSSQRYATSSYAITSRKVDLGRPGTNDWWSREDVGAARFRVTGAEGQKLFVAVGPQDQVENYLQGVPHDEVSDIRMRPFRATYLPQHTTGTNTPAAPDGQSFWVAKASGPGTQTLSWNLKGGQWAVVVMNADGSRNVAADVQAGLKVRFLPGIAAGLLGGGLATLLLGVILIVAGTVKSSTHPPAGTSSGLPARAPGHLASAPMFGAGSASAGYPPLRFEGHLDSNLSRWKWLVKWFLAIPHFVVLAFLWIAFSVLTVVAFFAILFTGQYPRSLFEFNVGVLRWTWRVNFYATNALGTDRYPPFSLADADYPARLDVAYPQHFSRGLVLIKSWLLALPHLILIGLLTATWSFTNRNGTRFGLNGGFLQLLVIIAAVVLLFTGRYPQGMFNLLMGLNRWMFRVVVYVALMTDVYPPFHLDQGPAEPTGGPRPLPPPAPSQATPERDFAHHL